MREISIISERIEHPNIDISLLITDSAQTMLIKAGKIRKASAIDGWRKFTPVPPGPRYHLYEHYFPSGLTAIYPGLLSARAWIDHGSSRAGF
jgi:hypothetical protein